MKLLFSANSVQPFGSIVLSSFISLSCQLTNVDSMIRCVRFASAVGKKREGFCVGIFKKEKSDEAICEDQLTSAGLELNGETKGRLLEQLNCSKPLKPGQCRMLYGLGEKVTEIVTVSSLGKFV